MRIAIVGLANSGKSTVLCALTGCEVGVGEHPFSTVECRSAPSLPRGGRRVDVVDTPGLCRGSAVGEGLGNAFLREVTDADVLVAVIRAFGRGLAAAGGFVERVDPFRDAVTLDNELAMADTGLIREWLAGHGASSSTDVGRVEALRSVLSAIEHGQSARTMGLAADELADLTGIRLLTAKPLIIVSNVDEEDLYDGPQTPIAEDLQRKADVTGTPVLAACARLEADSVRVDDVGSGSAEESDLVEELTGVPCLLTRLLNVCETMRLFPA